MNDLNKFHVIGRITQDVGNDERSFVYTSSGMARANVSIAVNHSRKTNEGWSEEVDYFNITIWGKTAENLKPYLVKGKQICVTAHLKQERWEKDGQKQSRIVIIADEVQLIGSNNQQGAQNSGAPRTTPAQQPAAAYDSGDDFPEDIPF